MESTNNQDMEFQCSCQDGIGRVEKEVLELIRLHAPIRDIIRVVAAGTDEALRLASDESADPEETAKAISDLKRSLLRVPINVTSALDTDMHLYDLLQIMGRSINEVVCNTNKAIGFCESVVNNEESRGKAEKDRDNAEKVRDRNETAREIAMQSLASAIDVPVELYGVHHLQSEVFTLRNNAGEEFGTFNIGYAGKDSNDGDPVYVGGFMSAEDYKKLYSIPDPLEIAKKEDVPNKISLIGTTLILGKEYVEKSRVKLPEAEGSGMTFRAGILNKTLYDKIIAGLMSAEDKKNLDAIQDQDLLIRTKGLDMLINNETENKLNIHLLRGEKFFYEARKASVDTDSVLFEITTSTGIPVGGTEVSDGEFIEDDTVQRNFSKQTFNINVIDGSMHIRMYVK